MVTFFDVAVVCVARQSMMTLKTWRSSTAWQSTVKLMMWVFMWGVAVSGNTDDVAVKGVTDGGSHMEHGSQ